MNEYRHHVSGFFAHRDEVERALFNLVQQGLPREQMQIYTADSKSSSLAQEAMSDRTYWWAVQLVPHLASSTNS